MAHLLMTIEANTGHLERHAASAQAAGTPASRAFNLHHAKNHVVVVSEHQVKLRDAVVRRVPAAGRELDTLTQAITGGTRQAGADLDRSLAHDLSSAMVAAGHVDRHLTEAQAAAGDPASVAFNIRHAVHHIGELEHYHHELREGLRERVPAVGPELDILYQLTGLNGTTAIPAPRGPQGATPARSRDGAAADYDVTGPDRGPQPA
jgi:hypothetical protein